MWALTRVLALGLAALCTLAWSAGQLVELKSRYYRHVHEAEEARRQLDRVCESPEFMHGASVQMFAHCASMQKRLEIAPMEHAVLETLAAIGPGACSDDHTACSEALRAAREHATSIALIGFATVVAVFYVAKDAIFLRQASRRLPLTDPAYFVPVGTSVPMWNDDDAIHGGCRLSVREMVRRGGENLRLRSHGARSDGGDGDDML